jgi:hypothetical protein
VVSRRSRSCRSRFRRHAAALSSSGCILPKPGHVAHGQSFSDLPTRCTTFRSCSRRISHFSGATKKQGQDQGASAMRQTCRPSPFRAPCILSNTTRQKEIRTLGRFTRQRRPMVASSDYRPQHNAQDGAKWRENSAAPVELQSEHGHRRQRVSRTPGWSPSMNSTPAASSARLTAAKLLIEGTRRPFSKSRIVLSLKLDRAANSA